MLHWNCKLPQVVEIMKISKWAPNAYWTAYCAKCDCCKSHWRLSLKKSQQLNGGHCIFVLRVWTLNPNMSIVCTLYMTCRIVVWMTSSQLLALLKAWRCHRGCISMAMWQFWQNFLVLGFRFRASEIEKKGKDVLPLSHQPRFHVFCFLFCFGVYFYQIRSCPTCVTPLDIFGNFGDAGVQSRRCKRWSHHWDGCHMGWWAKCPAHHQTLSQVPPWSRAWCWQNDIQLPDHEGRSGQPLLLWQGQTVSETLDGSYSCRGSCKGFLCGAAAL